MYSFKYAANLGYLGCYNTYLGYWLITGSLSITKLSKDCLFLKSICWRHDKLNSNFIWLYCLNVYFTRSLLFFLYLYWDAPSFKHQIWCCPPSTLILVRYTTVFEVILPCTMLLDILHDKGDCSWRLKSFLINTSTSLPFGETRSLHSPIYTHKGKINKQTKNRYSI